MQVAHVTGNMKSGQLPLAVPHLVEPGSNALADQTGIVDVLPGNHDIHSGPKLRNKAVEAKNGTTLIRGKRGAA